MQLIRVKLQDCLFKRIFSEGINELLSGDWHWDIISSILDRILSITPRFTYGLKEYAQSPGLPVSPFQSSGLADRDCSFDFSLRLPLPSLRFLRCALDRQDRQGRHASVPSPSSLTSVPSLTLGTGGTSGTGAMTRKGEPSARPYNRFSLGTPPFTTMLPEPFLRLDIK